VTTSKYAKASSQKPQALKQGGEQTHNYSLSKWILPGIIIFTCLLYSNSLNNNFTVFDDDSYIVNNPFLRDFSLKGIVAIFTSFYSCNYHPLTTLTWLFEYNLFGPSPLPFHLVNVMFHVLNTWLVFKLAYRLSNKTVTAGVTSLLFAIHPLHVESVVWVSELKDVQYTFFYLLSLLLYLRYISSGFTRKSYLFCLLLFIGSLLSKSAAVTLPLLLIVIDLYEQRKMDAKAMYEKIPFFALSVLFGILAILSQKSGGALNTSMLSYGFFNGIFVFLSGITFYIVWLVAPFKLAVMHCFPDVSNSLLPWQYYLSLPLMLLIVWVCSRRTIYRKEFLFGFAFFLVTLSVMLQIVSVGVALTSERYSYVASIGIFYIAGQLFAGSMTTPKKTLSTVLLVTATLLFSVLTWQRIAVWKDDSLLFNDMIEKYPDVYYGYWLRGNLEKRNGDLKNALSDYSEAIRLNPQYPDAFYNRAATLDASGNLRAALSDYDQALKLNPAQADVYNNRGWILFRLGDRTNAMLDYNKAISLNPNFAEAYNNRGWAYHSSGDTKSAMQDYNRAIMLNQAFVLPYSNRAVIKAQSGDFAGAIADYDKIISLRPDDKSAYYYRGMAYFDLNTKEKACADWNKAAELGNSNATEMINKYCR